MSIDDALASDNPIWEIARRLERIAPQHLTRPEIRFDGIASLHGDTLSGGFLASLDNVPGNFFQQAEALAVEYCDAEVVSVFASVKALFPDGVVPEERASRQAVIETLSDQWARDPFAQQTAHFYRVESRFRDAMIEFVRDHRADFANIVDAR